MRKLLINCLLSAGSLLFVLGALELGLRAAHCVPPRYVTPELCLDVAEMYKPNARGIWRGRLGTIVEFENLVITNSQMLHDTEHTFEKPADTYRIVLLGDSFVEAAQVPAEDTFFKITERELNKRPLPGLRGKKAEIIAIGKSGNGSIGELSDLTTLGLRYQPDLVVVFVLTENDFSDDLFYLYQKKENKHKTPIQFEDWKVYRVFDVYKRALLLKNSWVNGWIAFYLAERYRAPIAERESIGILKRDLGIYAAPDSRMFGEQLPSWESAIRLTSANYLKMKLICGERNSKFLVVLVDSQLLYNTRKRSGLYRMIPELKNEKLDFAKPFTRLKQVFGHTGIDYLDLNPAFEENYKNHGPATHFEHDGHWTPAGHKLAAKLLREYFEKEFANTR